MFFIALLPVWLLLLLLLLTYYELMFASYVWGVSRMRGDDMASSNQCDFAECHCASNESLRFMVHP